MTRRHYRMIDGKLTEVFRAPPRPRVALISDHHEPFKSMADGKIYDSKSAYRRECKARGHEELGNDVEMRTPEVDHGDIERDVAEAMESL